MRLRKYQRMRLRLGGMIVLPSLKHPTGEVVCMITAVPRSRPGANAMIDAIARPETEPPISRDDAPQGNSQNQVGPLMPTLDSCINSVFEKGV